MMLLGKPIEQLLGIGAILLLAIGCTIVLWPFLSALLWAAVICFATWPIYGWIEQLTGKRRGLASLLMTLFIAVVVVAPFAVIVATLGNNVSSLVTAAARVFEQGPPAPPEWVAGLPVLGDSLAAYWKSLAHNAPAFLAELKGLAGPATDVAVAVGAILGRGLLELALSVFIAFFLYRHGREMAAYVRGITERIAGRRAPHLLTVVTGTVKGVIYGLIGTALAQAALSVIGFWIAGVPQALLLGFLIFVLSFLPAGPVFVWGTVAVWLLIDGALLSGLFLAAWGALLVSSIDNVIKPYVIAKSNSLPILLSLAGFLGGIFAFGFIGIFLGPALLAVGYSLFLEWYAGEIDMHRRA
jgi:predicted PurR-regulated permease PerM